MGSDEPDAQQAQRRLAFVCAPGLCGRARSAPHPTSALLPPRPCLAPTQIPGGGCHGQRRIPLTPRTPALRSSRSPPHTPSQRQLQQLQLPTPRPWPRCNSSAAAAPHVQPPHAAAVQPAAEGSSGPRSHLSSRIFFTSLRAFCLAVGFEPDTTSVVTIDFSSTSSAYRVGMTWL